MDRQLAAVISQALTAPTAKDAEAAPPPRVLVSAKEAAKMLDVAPRTFFRLCKAEGFPAPVRLSGSIVRWRVVDLLGYITSLEAGHQSSAAIDARREGLARWIAAGRPRKGSGGDAGGEQVPASAESRADAGHPAEGHSTEPSREGIAA